MCCGEPITVSLQEASYSLTRLAAVKFPRNEWLTVQEDYCILIKIISIAVHKQLDSTLEIAEY